MMIFDGIAIVVVVIAVVVVGKGGRGPILMMIFDGIVVVVVIVVVIIIVVVISSIENISVKSVGKVIDRTIVFTSDTSFAFIVDEFAIRKHLTKLSFCIISEIVAFRIVLTGSQAIFL